MSVEARRIRPSRVRRTVSDRLREAVIALANHQGQIVDHRETPWASVTFAGARHTLSLLFLGANAVAAGEDFIVALPEHEFTIPGQIVADATISSCDQRMLPSARLAVTCELLLLEDG